MDFDFSSNFTGFPSRRWRIFGDYIMSHLVFTARWTSKAKRAYYVNRNEKPYMTKLIFYVWNVYHKVFTFYVIRICLEFDSHHEQDLGPPWEEKLFLFLGLFERYFLSKQVVPNLLFELNLCAVFLWDCWRAGSIIWHAGGKEPTIYILTIR